MFVDCGFGAGFAAGFAPDSGPETFLLALIGDGGEGVE